MMPDVTVDVTVICEHCKSGLDATFEMRGRPTQVPTMVVERCEVCCETSYEDGKSDERFEAETVSRLAAQEEDRHER
jgi:hypothetical protein